MMCCFRVCFLKYFNRYIYEGKPRFLGGMEKHNALFTCPDWWHLQPQTLDLILVAEAGKSPMGPGLVVNHRGVL